MSNGNIYIYTFGLGLPSPEFGRLENQSGKYVTWFVGHPINPSTESGGLSYSNTLSKTVIIFTVPSGNSCKNLEKDFYFGLFVLLIWKSLNMWSFSCTIAKDAIK